jgi:peroxiredoxin
MKYFLYIFILLCLVSCGPDGNSFRIRGNFRDMQAGELYIYNLNGNLARLDTINIQEGKFRYRGETEEVTPYILVFPNGVEQVIFAGPGEDLEYEATANDLKNYVVNGSEENELMNKFRKQILNVSPPEEVKLARQFIADHPQSVVSVYLLRRYFVQTTEPDYKEAAAMAAKMLEHQPKNGTLINLQRDAENLKRSQLNATIPAFSATDTKGRSVNKSLFDGRVGVIYTWATWNYEGQNLQRELKRLQRKYGASRLALMGVCIDPGLQECKRTIDRDSVTWSVVCDGKLFESPIIRQLGLRNVPDNILIDSRGRVVAHGLDSNELLERIKKLL